MSAAPRVVIVDYESGNIGSIVNMLKKIGVDARLSASRDDVLAAPQLILPGVGAFDAGMEAINRLGLVDVLNQKVLEQRTPILGICLGMQLLTRGSEEGALPGFGWIAGRTVRFQFQTGSPLRVPHMGWNRIFPRAAPALFEGADEELRAYFANSYHVVCDQPEEVLAVSNYGYEFACMVRQGNVTGMQFHPEKSHSHGMLLLKNYFRTVDA